MVSVIYSTIDKIQDARRIAHTLVEEQLVVCVNIIPKIESIYRWKGKIENDEECVLIAKTTDKNVKKTIKRIKALHTYELPDIIVLPIIGGLKDYLDYINDETS
ncbi:MAG: divalent-cation tolerance protein CutA [Thermoplasmatales archaeon]|nr:divalent-cation tolerance protein CutA [Thermoplasmatales archaeon]MCK5030602.1 divalent-cation tolerance protein CutA [Thermoplasmatales archaeon]